MPRFVLTGGLETALADASALEVEAALALGRLDGALGACPPATLRLFAGTQLRAMLIAALRQEGHAFTEPRFHAWFAGLVTLSDEAPRHARPPRVLVEAVLTEMTHSSWEPLASLATRLLPALLAPQDYSGGELDEDAPHEEAHAVIAAARRLIETPGKDRFPLPFPALASLHRAVGQDLTFAPTERNSEPISLGPLRMTVERARLPSPRWAIELLWGEQWRSAGILRYALPWPGLIRLDALQGDLEPGEARIIIATALRDGAQVLSGQLADADHLAQRSADRSPGRRSTSRAPALFELLAGFGALRSAQIETLLGASRLGVRTMLAALDALSVLECRTIAGVRLYALRPAPEPEPTPADALAPLAFSSAAVADFNAAMANADDVLARLGVDIDEGDERDPA
jgi:hypothetical protein